MKSLEILKISKNRKMVFNTKNLSDTIKVKKIGNFFLLYYTLNENYHITLNQKEAKELIKFLNKKLSNK